MSDREKSKEQLIEELTLLRREVAELRTVKKAFNAQTELLKALGTMERTVTGSLLLKGMSQEILKISSRVTNAEGSSLFLLNADGVVTDSILSRGAIIQELRQNLIDKVVDQGLAGWVIRHRQVGLITDTKNDNRWLTLPSQPYTVRSALGVPILRGQTLLGVLTLMHSQPGHFHLESARLMQAIAEQMALILDNALLYINHQQPESESHKTQQQIGKELHSTEQQLLSEANLSVIGIYILMGEGKFLYANPRLAEIFGYTFGELISLESVFDLVTANNRNLVVENLYDCLHGSSKNLSCTFQGQGKDGRLIDVEIYGTRTRFYGQSVVIGVLRPA